MGNLTSEKLPEAVPILTKEVSELKRLLIKKMVQALTEQPEQLLTIQEAAELLSFTVPRMYIEVSKGKRLYFSNIELLEYLKDGLKKSKAEIEQEVKRSKVKD